MQRGVWQCVGLKLRYCKTGGSSRGVRDFIRNTGPNGLIELAKVINPITHSLIHCFISFQKKCQSCFSSALATTNPSLLMTTTLLFIIACYYYLNYLLLLYSCILILSTTYTINAIYC